MKTRASAGRIFTPSSPSEIKHDHRPARGQILHSPLQPKSLQSHHQRFCQERPTASAPFAPRSPSPGAVSLHFLNQKNHRNCSNPKLPIPAAPPAPIRFLTCSLHAGLSSPAPPEPQNQPLPLPPRSRVTGSPSQPPRPPPPTSLTFPAQLPLPSAFHSGGLALI